MKIPCRECIIQPICTDKCDEFFKYGAGIFKYCSSYANWSVIYEEYKYCDQTIFNRKYRNYQGESK